MSNQQTTAVAGAAPGDDARFEGLLPADGPDADLEVAEEVALDLQSDSTRRVGALPPDTPVSKPAEALAQAMGPAPADGSPEQPGREQLDEAIDRAVPPSV